jgi:hypothetical protein
MIPGTAISEINPRQLRAAALLVAGNTARAVAQDIQVTPETISIWKRDPEFQRLLLQFKVEAAAACRDMISSAVVDAAQTLVTLVREGKSDEVRRRAALDVLALSGIRDDSGRLTSRTFEEAELQKTEEAEAEEHKRALLAELRNILRMREASAATQIEADKPRPKLLSISDAGKISSS